MGFHAVLVQVIQQNGGNLVVQGPLPLETGPLDIVVGNGHILVAENHLVGVIGGEHLLLVSFEN